MNRLVLGTGRAGLRVSQCNPMQQVAVGRPNDLPATRRFATALPSPCEVPGIRRSCWPRDFGRVSSIRRRMPVPFLVAALLQQPGVSTLDRASVAPAFRAVRSVTLDDRARLWGRSLAGPVMIVDAQSRRFIGRRADGRDVSGELPPEINPANTAFTYAGTRWTMLVLPIPRDGLGLRQLVAHELWHRIQDSLGMPGSNPDNGHLDREAGRVWVRLEARALARAVAESGSGAAASFRDALAFRAARYRAAAADSNESMLERSEGLAEYTGIRLSGRSTRAQLALVVAALHAMESHETIARSFAYATGPAYGVLLDRFRPGWRRELRDGSSLFALAARAVGQPEPATTAREVAYDGERIRAEESSRAMVRESRRRDLVARFVTGPTLVLPLAEANVGFDPGRAESLDSLGTVYGGLRLTDRWGVLEAAESGGLVGPTWQHAAVPVDSTFTPMNPAGSGVASRSQGQLDRRGRFSSGAVACR